MALLEKPGIGCIGVGLLVMVVAAVGVASTDGKVWGDALPYAMFLWLGFVPFVVGVLWCLIGGKDETSEDDGRGGAGGSSASP